MNIIYPRDGVAHPDVNQTGHVTSFEQLSWSEDEAPTLMQYWRILHRRKKIVLGTIGLAVAAGAIFTLFATPQYIATTKIEISREVEMTEDMEGGTQQPRAIDLEFYQTQYGLLESRSLARRVAKELKLAEDENFRSFYGLKSGEGLFSGTGAQTSPTPAQRARRLDETEKALLKNIIISPTIDSRLIDVSFSSPDPQFSARIANKWVETFIEQSLERRFESASYARKFLEERLGQVRTRLEDAERALVAYASRQGIVNLNSDAAGSEQAREQSVAANNLSLMNAALAAATADRIRAESRLQQVSAGGSTVEGLSNQTLSMLRQRRAEGAAELAQLLVDFDPEYPRARALQSRVDSLDAAIAREVDRVGGSIRQEYESALERENNLKGKVDSLKSQVLDLRRRGIQYNILQRDVDTSRELYQGLLQRYKQIGIAGGVGRNNIAVVDRASVPEEPSSPNILLNLLLSLIGGAAVGVGLAFALHQLDEGLSDPEEIYKRLGIASLGTITKAEDGDILAALSDPASNVSEGYMAVRTNLEFSTANGVPYSIVVTSSRPAEGKSTTALGLALVLARLGSRVLLVDADLRSPSVHRELGLTNPHGLANYLTGQSELESLVQAASFDNLSVISSGPLPPNAAEILAGEGFANFLSAARERYDHVVVDAPPVLGLADAPLLGGAADAVVFVIESGVTKVGVTQRAISRLRFTKSHLLGAILTKFEPRFASYDYGDAYGYSYGDKLDRAA